MKIDTDTVTTCYDTPIAGMRSYNQPLIVCQKCNVPKIKEQFLVHHKTAGFPSTDIHCKDCRNEYNRLQYAKNKEKRKVQNIESRKLHSKKYKETSNIRMKKYTKNLTDDYLVNLIYRGTNLKSSEIKQLPELIEIKRLIIKTKRLCKTLQHLEQV
jgi:hypothetical protein